MKRLAIVITHPIQYFAPWFALLAARGRVTPRAFYTLSQAQKPQHDSGFGRKIEWDIPLLEGYEHEFVENVAKAPGYQTFRGIVNPELNPRIEHWGADAVLVIGWNYQSHLGAMRHFKDRIPVYFRGDSHLLDLRPGLRSLARQLWLGYVYRHVDRAFYVGSNSRDYYLRYGVPSEHLIHAPHAIDNRRFEDPDGAYAGAAAAWRAELGIPAEALLVLFAGKLEKKKQPEMLLEAVRGVDRGDVHLVFVGNGELEDGLRRSAEGLAHVHFVPFQNQSRMPVVYRLGDVLCLPSGWDETWGLAVNEAMACGRPALVSDRVGCARDLVRDGETGYAFPVGDSDALCDRIRTLADQRERLPELGRRAHDEIRNWSFDSICDAIEAAMDSGLH